MGQIKREGLQNGGVKIFNGMRIAQIALGVFRFQIWRGARLANKPAPLDPAARQCYRKPVRPMIAAA